MDRAEKLAMEQYPVPKDNIFANSVRNAQRAAFQLGYLTAEQDLALTWEGIKAIVTIADSMLTHTAWDAIDWPDEQKYYEEVLRRFNEQREKK